MIVEGIGILGGYPGPGTRTPTEFDADSPIVRIKGFALVGGVDVKRKPIPKPGWAS